MDFRELVLVISAICLAVCNALKCKCTQSSWKTPCEDGICEVPTGESSCLMLDHPTSGRHYACSQSQLDNGICTEKITKSGAAVNVCSCDNSDFCNFKLWPPPPDTSSIENPINKSPPTKIITTRENPPINSAISIRYDSLFLFSVFQLVFVVIGLLINLE